VLETLIDVDRKRYLAEFSCPSNGDLRLEFKEQSDKYFPVLENTNVARWGNVRNLAADQFQKGMQLFADGIYNSSLEHFNTALYLDPKDADAWNDGGAALFRARRFSDAVNYFQHALEVDPKLHDARLNLAKALIHCGRGSEALTVLEEYTRSNPTNAEANQLLKELKTSAASGKP
jgi:Flp pilus assembly protein TadD